MPIRQSEFYRRFEWLGQFSLAEISPAERRGRMVTQNELMIVTGQFLAFLINAIIAVVMEGENHVWRYMLSVAALPAVFI